MLSDILCEGAEYAISARELCVMLGTNMREITLTIERERREGKPICASVTPPYGYYLAANRAEMEGYCRALSRRATELQKTWQACLATIDSLPE